MHLIKQSHLSLHIVNSAAGSIHIGAVVLIIHFLDGMIDLIFYLETCSQVTEINFPLDCGFLENVGPWNMDFLKTWDRLLEIVSKM